MTTTNLQINLLDLVRIEPPVQPLVPTAPPAAISPRREPERSADVPHPETHRNPSDVGDVQNAHAENVVATVLDLVAVPCQVLSIQATNASGATAYVHVYFARPAMVSQGTTPPDLIVAVANAATVQIPLSGAKARALSVASTTGAMGTTGSSAGVYVSAQYDTRIRAGEEGSGG